MRGKHACQVQGEAGSDEPVTEPHRSPPARSLNTHTRLSGWLFRVAHNRCIDELRKRYRRNEVCFSALEWESTGEELSPVERIAGSQPLPEEIAVQRDLHDTLRRAIVVLPPKFRRVVHLRCWRDLSFAE